MFNPSRGVKFPQILLTLIVYIFHLDAKNEETVKKILKNLTCPTLKFTRKCKRASGILHPWLVMLNLDIHVPSAFANRVDQDQLASEEAN